MVYLKPHIRQAFRAAGNAIGFSNRQNAELDDNGNAIPGELIDGLFSQNYSIGSGVLLAGDEPLVTGALVSNPLSNQFEDLVVDSVTTTGTIDRVIAVITQPDQTSVELELRNINGVYSAPNSPALCAEAGNYNVAAYAIDTDGLVSIPATASTNRSEACAPFLFFNGFE